MERVIMVVNSSMSTAPSPSVSTPLTILLHSSKLHLSPSLPNTSNNSSAFIFPSRFKSNARNALCMSLVFTPPPFLCTSTNSLKSINPSPSRSATWNIFSTSVLTPSFTKAPSTALYSSCDIFPSLLESNLSNTFFSSSMLRWKIGGKSEFCLSLEENSRDGFRRYFLLEILYWKSRKLGVDMVVLQRSRKPKMRNKDEINLTANLVFNIRMIRTGCLSEFDPVCVA